MTKSKMNPNVEFYFSKAKKWQEEFEKLRMIVLDCQLTKELKWGVPCYTFQKRNIVLIHGFKEYCALLFFKGALLNDSQGILIQQTENVQAGRRDGKEHTFFIFPNPNNPEPGSQGLKNGCSKFSIEKD